MKGCVAARTSGGTDSHGTRVHPDAQRRREAGGHHHYHGPGESQAGRGMDQEDRGTEGSWHQDRGRDPSGRAAPRRRERAMSAEGSAPTLHVNVVLDNDRRLAENIVLELRALACRQGLDVTSVTVVQAPVSP